MNTARILITFIASLFAGAASATIVSVCPANRSDYFCLSPDMAPNSLIQKYDFYEISQKVVFLFAQELDEKKYPLQLNADWESPFMGAGVSLYKEAYRLMILGGTARIEGMTHDAFAALVCHELGHILGGPPTQTMTGSDWASVEGQADYYAASVCLPRYFSSLSSSPSEALERIEAAGFALFSSLSPHSSQTRGEPLQRGPSDLPSVEETLQAYPSVQCRYEQFRTPSRRASCWFAP